MNFQMLQEIAKQNDEKMRKSDLLKQKQQMEERLKNLGYDDIRPKAPAPQMSEVQKKYLDNIQNQSNDRPVAPHQQVPRDIKPIGYNFDEQSRQTQPRQSAQNYTNAKNQVNQGHMRGNFLAQAGASIMSINSIDGKNSQSTYGSGYRSDISFGSGSGMTPPSLQSSGSSSKGKGI